MQVKRIGRILMCRWAYLFEYALPQSPLVGPQKPLFLAVNLKQTRTIIVVVKMISTDDSNILIVVGRPQRPAIFDLVESVFNFCSLSITSLQVLLDGLPPIKDPDS